MRTARLSPTLVTLALLAPFDRPLALHLLGEVDRPRSTGSPAIPPLGHPVEPREPSAEGSRAVLARSLTHLLLTDATPRAEVIAEIEASVDEKVALWSPCLCAGSRAELLAALLDGDDAISEVQVAILGTSTSESTVLVEWRLEGRFSNAGFLNDDVLVEPSGARVEATGVLVVAFEQDRATNIRCYFDCLGLLEQVIDSRRRA